MDIVYSGLIVALVLLMVGLAGGCARLMRPRNNQVKDARKMP